MKTINILGISGSLKSTSANTRMLYFIKSLLGENVNYTVINNLDTLPHFNPDKEAGDMHIATFKKLLDATDAVIICSPEYAFGVPGTLKNALDWTVHTGNLNTKPLALITCSPLHEGGKRCMTSLIPTLQALGTNTPENCLLNVGDIYNKMNVEGEIKDEITIKEIRQLLQGLFILLD